MIARLTGGPADGRLYTVAEHTRRVDLPAIPCGPCSTGGFVTHTYTKAAASTVDPTVVWFDWTHCR